MFCRASLSSDSFKHCFVAQANSKWMTGFGVTGAAPMCQPAQKTVSIPLLHICSNYRHSLILAYPPHRKFGGIVRFHHTSTQITFSSSASFLLFLIFRIWPWNLVWMSYLRVVRCKFRFHSVSNWMAWYISSDPHMHLAALHHTCDLNIGFHMSR